MASVDVVVPCYNYARFLDRCVGSVLSQSGVDVRVLVIDDASSDDSSARATALAQRDPRVSTYRHVRNKGHIATYNEGLLEWAAADYSLLLSADDLLTPGALLRAATIMNKHAEVGLVYGPAIIVRDDADPPSLPEPTRLEYRVIDGFSFLQRSFSAGNPVPTPTAVVRTALQKRVGGYDASLPHSGDMEMWMRFAAEGRVGIVTAPQAYYREHGASMSLSYYSTAIGDRRERLAACRRIRDVWLWKYPQLTGLFADTARVLASQALWTASAAFDDGNEQTCATCIALSQEMYPREYVSRRWWKLRAKRALGVAAWKRCLPILRRLRGIAAHSSPGHSTPGVTLQPQIGWLADEIGIPLVREDRFA
jgi:hypothetical protein